MPWQARTLAVLGALGLVAVGCASGDAIDPRRGSSEGGVDGGSTRPDSPSGTDVDLDGVPGERDCDDTNPAVGSTAERVCSSSCADGIEQCVDGIWMACTAPTACDCNPGDPPRTLDCGMCGTQTQVCTDGHWVDDGACTGKGVCSPGAMEAGAACGNCGMDQRTCQSDCTWGASTCMGSGECAAGTTEMGTQGCGDCGAGTQTRTRTCDPACSWEAWSDWGTCMTGTTCTAGTTDRETRACGNCNTGTQSRTRTCSATTCTWGAWGTWSTCSGGGACAPGATRAGSCDPCSHQVCSTSCAWSTCRLRSGNACEWRSGTHFRCCGSSRWQFCLSSCQWSTDCAACSGCGC